MRPTIRATSVSPPDAPRGIIKVAAQTIFARLFQFTGAILASAMRPLSIGGPERVFYNPRMSPCPLCPRDRLRLFALAFLGLASTVLACGSGPGGLSVFPGRPQSRRDVRARAVEKIRQGEPREALSLLEASGDPRNPDDAFLMGEAALRSGRYAQAERAYRQVLKARPEDLVAST